MANAARRMQDSLQKVQVSFDKLMQSRRLDAHEGGGLDMAGMMKPECAEACPGVTDMMKTFMELATQSTTAAPPGKEGEAMMAMLQEVLCPHMETMDCMSKTDKCKSTTRRLDAHGGESDMDMMGMIGCLCVCPDLSAMSSDGDASMQAMCANPEGTIGCMTSKSECSAMQDMMKQSMPPSMQDNMMGYFGVACEYAAEKCESKMGECEGGEEAGQEYETKKCGSPETTDKTTCCATVKKIADCQGQKCVSLGFVMMQMNNDPETAQMFEETLKVSKACPEVGLPKSKDEVTAVMKESEAKITGADTGGGDGGGDAADGAPHTIPAFGMVATVLAFAAVANN
eukprot:gnl/MRDRNA2_/MRDRNA2_87347_c0_seq1.p1 gnl/MRDRNA2_/MRDRNA2_87347_c0~~gnl/MRDRNA2_/MRDRNA2_87347_c0_seq1.p1  ORF type:complete len:400 (+),score=79.83 gnl/MRDRNA2_/MRDRNA2_87347_c0_seq1:175-1200(+)